MVSLGLRGFGFGGLRVKGFGRVGVDDSNQLFVSSPLAVVPCTCNSSDCYFNPTVGVPTPQNHTNPTSP